MKYLPFYAGFFLFVTLIYFTSRSSYEIENDFMSHARLADKSATIENKSIHTDLMMENIDKCNLSGHDAFWFKTPNNSYDSNYVVLQDYQRRLTESRSMDITSFEYQAAIAQIEDCKVYKSLNVIKSIWYKEHYRFLWDWMGFILWTSSIFLMIWGIIVWLIEIDY